MSLYTVLEQQNKLTEVYFYKIFNKIASKDFNDRSQVRIVSDNSFSNCINQFKSNSDEPNTRLPICAIKISQPKEELSPFSIRGPYIESNEDNLELKVLPISNEMDLQIYYDSFESIQYIYELFLFNRSKIYEVKYKAKDFPEDEQDISMTFAPNGNVSIGEYPSHDQRKGKSNPGYIYSMNIKFKRYSSIYTKPTESFDKIIKEVIVDIYNDSSWSDEKFIEEVKVKE